MAIEYKGTLDGGSSKSKGAVTSTRVLLFFFDNYEKSYEILAQAQIPVDGAAHPSIPSLRFKDLSIEGNNGIRSGTYKVHCNYTSESSANFVDYDPDTPPWELPAYGFSLTTVDNIVVFDKAYGPKDKKGTPSVPVESTARTPLAAQKNDQHLIMKFTYNVQTFHDSWIEDFCNTVNLSYDYIASHPIQKNKGLLRILSPSPKKVYDDSGNLKWEYSQVDTEIEISDRGFLREIANESLYFMEDELTRSRIYTNGVDCGTYEAMGGKGKAFPVDVPMPLEIDGSINKTGANIYYRSFPEKFPASWGALGFPASRW